MKIKSLTEEDVINKCNSDSSLLEEYPLLYSYCTQNNNKDPQNNNSKKKRFTNVNGNIIC